MGVKEFIEVFNKRVGRKNAAVLASDRGYTTYLSTGVLALDLALCGGIPENRKTLIFGEQDSGKTLLCINILKSFMQKYPDATPIIIDGEGHWSNERLEYHGIDPSKVVVLTTTMLQELADGICAIPEYLTDSSNLVIVDSIVSLISKEELNASNEDSIMGRPALAMSRFMKHLNYAQVANTGNGHKLTLVMTNQYRLDPGKMFGDNRVLPGGRAPTQVSDIHIELKKHKKLQLNDMKGALKDSLNDQKFSRDHTIATYHQFDVKKLKLSSPFSTGDFYFFHVKLPEPLNKDLGHIPDESTILNFLKMPEYKMITGNAGNYKIPLVQETFRTYDDILKYLLQNKYKKDLIAIECLKVARREAKLREIPADNYLYGFTIVDEVECEAPEV